MTTLRVCAKGRARDGFAISSGTVWNVGGEKRIVPGRVSLLDLRMPIGLGRGRRSSSKIFAAWMSQRRVGCDRTTTYDNDLKKKKFYSGPSGGGAWGAKVYLLKEAAFFY